MGYQKALVFIILFSYAILFYMTKTVFSDVLTLLAILESWNCLFTFPKDVCFSQMCQQASLYFFFWVAYCSLYSSWNFRRDAKSRKCLLEGPKAREHHHTLLISHIKQTCNLATIACEFWNGKSMRHHHVSSDILAQENTCTASSLH